MLNSLRGRRLWGILLLFVAAQVWFTLSARHLRAVIDEMPPAPNERALKAMALGDDEFLFRHLSRWLQFVGDGGGRIRPLREYNYDRVVNWMEALDQLDENRSDYVHEVAARYFGEITKSVDTGNARVRKIVDYLRIVGLRDPARGWQWLVWAADRARNPINDPILIEAVARDLLSPELRNPKVPAWVRLLPIQLYNAAGDNAAARDVLARAAPADIAEIEREQRTMYEGAEQLRNGNPAPLPAKPK